MRVNVRIVYLTVSIIISCSCSDHNPYNCEMDEAVMAGNDSLLNLPHATDGLLRLLKKMDEPNLETLPDKAFRLTIEYSFDRDIWVYRIEKKEEGAIMRIEQTYKPGYNYMNVGDTILTKYISEEDWNELEKTFQVNCFWTIPAPVQERGLDGATYILEAYDPDAENPAGHTYHLAARWTPRDTTEFGKICAKIQSLGNTVTAETENIFPHH